MTPLQVNVHRIANCPIISCYTMNFHDSTIKLCHCSFSMTNEIKIKTQVDQPTQRRSLDSPKGEAKIQNTTPTPLVSPRISATLKIFSKNLENFFSFYQTLAPGIRPFTPPPSYATEPTCGANRSLGGASPTLGGAVAPPNRPKRRPCPGVKL